MTNKNSPLSALKAQADKIAFVLKAAERGEPLGEQFAAKVAASRLTPFFKVGIAMDDKIITLEIPWTFINITGQIELSEFIVHQMRETPPH